jgi:ribonuclease P protein component
MDPVVRRAGLRRTQHLRGQGAFGRLLRRGRRAEGEFFRLIASPVEGTRPRLGLTLSRRLGTAVVRNRIRRRVRELFRLWPPVGLDVVVQPKAGVLTAEFTVLRAEWLRVLDRARVVDKRRGAPSPAAH